MLMPPVSRYMTPGPLVVSTGTSIAGALELMREHRIRHLPVVDDGKLVGIAYDRDLRALQACARIDPADERIEDAMVGSVVTVPEGATLDEVAELMAQSRCDSVVVTTADGQQIRGIFTATDALVALSELLSRATA